MEIKGKTFLVAGGSSGLGAACVRDLAAKGASVVIADLQEEAGTALADSLNGRALFTHTDVTSEESVEACLAKGVAEFGSFDGVINCAGIAIAERILGRSGPHDLARFGKVIHVNLIGTFNVLRLAAAVMSENLPSESGERGVIINTASVAAYDGQIGQAAYAASKGGVVALTLPAARELARFGIRVMTIAPGIFDTPMLAGLPEKARLSLGEQVPFPSRLGRPEEFAQLAMDIIKNEMLNGAVIRLDGAIRMAPK